MKGPTKAPFGPAAIGFVLGLVALFAALGAPATPEGVAW